MLAAAIAAAQIAKRIRDIVPPGLACTRRHARGSLAGAQITIV
jgi:hypothetical protein